MELVTIANDRIIVELTPPDCLRLAQACKAADCTLAGFTPRAPLFGQPTAGTAACHRLGALYQALAVAFEVGAYAGEASYHVERDRHLLSLAALAERYGGAPRPGEEAAR